MTSKKLLFLGYDEKETKLIGALKNMGFLITNTDKPIKSYEEYDFIVSFGYRHIISKSTIEAASAPIINLHISFLPWNRGAHPLFWSFYDETPCGITIHLIDEGIDTGPILYQELIDINAEKITFKQAYEKLLSKIENLFLLHIDELVSFSYTLKAQKDKGSYHKSTDLPQEFQGWNTNISEEIKRLKNIRKIKG
tara:strand:- start:769 stop:1353 length:585 start_codon:yes stop_codon:yes gene_type:complete